MRKKACNLSRSAVYPVEIDDYAKDGGPGVVWLSCSFYRGPLRSLIVKEVRLLCHLISHWFQIED